MTKKVSEIQELTDNEHRRHVPTKQNPADQASRGWNGDELNNTMWFGDLLLLNDPLYGQLAPTSDSPQLTKH